MMQTSTKRYWVPPKRTRRAVFAASTLSILLSLTASLCSPGRVNDNVVGTRQVFSEHTVPARTFTKVPQKHARTFYFDDKSTNIPMMRALRSHGWRRVDAPKHAHLLVTAVAYPYYETLQPWQRFNRVANHGFWCLRDSFVKEFKAYQEKTGVVPYFLPESYRLESRKERHAFHSRITEAGGSNLPWILKDPSVKENEGIEVIPPNSDRLLQIADQNSGADRENIVQEYLCGRNFDVRMFWFVASVNPLIVLYQDGYARFGNDGNASFDDLANHIVKHHRSSPELAHIRNPLQHVKSQFKDSLAEFIAAFKDSSFSPIEEELSSENGFGFYAADFIVDEDLDVWLIDLQKDLKMDDSDDFLADVFNRLFHGVVDALEEIWHKQEDRKHVMPLHDTGEWEVIYADGSRFAYEGYERSKAKKGCGTAASRQGGIVKERERLQSPSDSSELTV